jgi:transcription elongation GreA/GreB family factor
MAQLKLRRRCPGSQILRRQPIATNLGKVIRFEVGDLILERRLVQMTDSAIDEIHVDSPVGKALAKACVGEQYAVHVPEGTLVVRVLEIKSSLTQEPAR